MRVIYIAGASHSGSTLLDMMLNAHPEIISVGELLKLNRVKRSKSGKPKFARCSCGAAGLLRCEFWSRVNERTLLSHGTSLADLDLNDCRHPAEGPDANSILFRAISEVSGKEFVVDSSKMPRRLKHLMGFDELNVYAIHLVRDPRGQIASVIAKNGLMKSILYHEVVHAQTRSALKSVPHSIARYEDLVSTPEKTLGQILEPLGLRFDPRQLQWAEQVKHSFAGNHVRKQSKSELVLDEGWKHRLSPGQISLIKLGTVLSQNRMRRAG
jgi:sulfotransferase family protein